MPSYTYKYKKDSGGNVTAAKAYSMKGSNATFDANKTISKYKELGLSIPSSLQKLYVAPAPVNKGGITAIGAGKAPSTAGYSSGQNADLLEKQRLENQYGSTQNLTETGVQTPNTYGQTPDVDAAVSQPKDIDSRGLSYKDYLAQKYDINPGKYGYHMPDEYNRNQTEINAMNKLGSYLKAIGNDSPSFGDLAWLAGQYGINDYIGKKEQSQELMDKINLGIQKDGGGVFGQSTYTGPSIVDYLKSVGQRSDRAFLTEIATKYGIENYRGTAEQNTSMLNSLRNGQQDKSTDPSVQWEKQPDVQDDELLDDADGIVSSASTVEEGRKQDEGTAIEEYNKEMGGMTREYEKLSMQQKIAEMTEAMNQSTGGRPEVPQTASLFEALTSDSGTQAIESRINALDADAREITDGARYGRQDEEGRLASNGIISRRQTAINRQAQEQLDAINRERATLVDELTTKNNMISNYMKFAQQDYTNASNAYNAQFSQNMQMINLVEKYESQEQAEENILRDDARANLTFMTNSMKDSSTGWIDLDGLTKQQIYKLEAQSGMPIGITKEFINVKPDTEVMYTTKSTDASGNEFVSFVYKGEDGKTGVIEKVMTGGYNAPKSTDKDKYSITDTWAYGQKRHAEGISDAQIRSELDANSDATVSTINSVIDGFNETGRGDDENIPTQNEVIALLPGNDDGWDVFRDVAENRVGNKNKGVAEKYYKEWIKKEMERLAKEDYTNEEILSATKDSIMAIYNKIKK